VTIDNKEYNMTTQDWTRTFRAMSPNEVRDARRALGLTLHELAVLLRMGGDGKRSVRRWEDGDREISGPASVAIEALLTGWRPSKLDVDV
jgi:DNA-binding transcriptional regulator YiaG